MQQQLKKGVLHLCALTVIEEKDSYAYEVFVTINEIIGISESTVYPILRKLVSEKYCETYFGETSEGQPCKYFKITDLGRQKIREMRNEWKEFVSQINTIIKEG